MRDCKYRAIQDAFWNDIMIVELEPDEKLVYLWLMTNRHLDICGCYQVSHKTIEYETGIPWSRGREIFRKFEEMERLLYSEQNREVLLLKWKKNNEGFFKSENHKSVNSIRTGVDRIKTPEFKNIILQWLGDDIPPVLPPILPPTVAPTIPPTTQPEPKPEPELEPKVKSMEHVEFSVDEFPEKAAGGQAENQLESFTERQIRQAIEDRKQLIKEKFPEVDVQIETEEIVAKYRGQSLVADPWVLISRWFKNLKKPDARGRESPVTERERLACDILGQNKLVCELFGVNQVKSRFAALMFWLANKFPQEKLPRKLKLEDLDDYWLAIGKIKIERLEFAGRHWFANAGWFPRPAELRESANKAPSDVVMQEMIEQPEAGEEVLLSEEAAAVMFRDIYRQLGCKFELSSEV